MLAGIFSPLVKIFVPYHEAEIDGKTRIVTLQDLIDDFSLVKQDYKFWLTVPRSAGDIKFAYKAPKFIKDLDMLEWLTGGPQGEFKNETDWTGCVQVDMPQEDLGEVLASVAGGGKTSGELSNSLSKSVQKASILSNKRVMRQVRMVWNNYMAQVKANKEVNLGNPTFSPTEYLCSKILADEVALERQRMDKQAKEMEAIAGIIDNATQTRGPSI